MGEVRWRIENGQFARHCDPDFTSGEAISS